LLVNKPFNKEADTPAAYNPSVGTLASGFKNKPSLFSKLALNSNQ